MHITKELIHDTVHYEGFSGKMYKDSREIWSIGIGTNLEAGISYRQAEALMKIHYEDEVFPHLVKLSYWDDLSPNRQRSLAEMLYQLGYTRFLKFKNMHRALADKDYERAANEMLDSLWFRQTPKRPIHCAKLMRDG